VKQTQYQNLIFGCKNFLMTVRLVAFKQVGLLYGVSSKRPYGLPLINKGIKEQNPFDFMKRKLSRKGLVAALDKIVSLIVRLRDKQCVLCGKRQNLQCGHLFSRVWYQIRWNLLNCHTQCSGCNFKHEHDSYPFQEWFKKKFGELQYHSLYQQAHNGQKYSDQDLVRLLFSFQAFYKDQLLNERNN
jgi:hypothetical protein